MVRKRLAAVFVAGVIAVTACSGEPAGRQPPDEVRGSSEYGRSGFYCERGTLPAEAVWYPPHQVVVVGSDALAAGETRFQCPDYVSSGNSDLLEVETGTQTLDLYVDGASGEHGVVELHATWYPPNAAPRRVEASELEPDWYRIDVPGAAAGWIIRLDLVTELGWESSYAFQVAVRR